LIGRRKVEVWKAMMIPIAKRGGGAQNVEIYMVFELSREFGMPEPVAAQLTLGAERAIFEKTQHTRAAYETIVYQRSLGRHAS
jgi:hypothetical protein